MTDATPILYSRGNGPRDNTPRALQADDFPAFVEAIKSDPQAEKGTGWISGPLAKAADDDWHNSSDSKKRAIGRHHRCSKCALPRRWIGGDIDNGSTLQARGMTPEMMFDLVQYMQRYSALVYTTHSHKPDIPRLRYIVEMDRAATRDELKRASAAMRTRIDNHLKDRGGHAASIQWDDAADAAELPLYLPGPGAEFYECEGTPAILDELLREVPERPRPVRTALLDPSELSERAEMLRFVVSRIGNDGAILEYDDWLKVLMACHHETGGSDDGLAVADEFSARSTKHDEAVTAYKYASFTAGHPTPVTLHTIERMAQVGYQDLIEAAEAMTPEEAEKKPNLLSLYARLADRRLKTMQTRMVYSKLKSATKVPMGVLEDAAKEKAHGIGDEMGGEPDHLDLANATIQAIGADNLIHVPGNVYRWRDSGVWRPTEGEEVRQWVQRHIAPLVEEVTKGLVDGVTATLKTELFKPDHQFNIGDAETVNTPSGEVALVAGEWRLLPHEKTAYRTTQIPVEFDPDATAPRFSQFLEEVFPGDTEQQAALLEMMGYSLMAHCRHEKFVILIGAGANGKSVVLKVLEALCGRENVAAVQPHLLDSPFQRAYLHERLVNIVSEIKQGTILDDDALKAITSGESTTVEHKFGHPFNMRPFSTCWFGTNHMPHTRDFSEGLFRRSLILTFEQTFKPELGNHDPNLIDKLLSELPGVLNMALGAYGRAINHGFTVPAKAEQARAEWRLETDQVAQFVDDECTAIPGKEVMSSDLYKRYQRWADDAGIHKKMTHKGFTQRLARLGYPAGRNRVGRFISGLSLGGISESERYAEASGGS